MDEKIERTENVKEKERKRQIKGGKESGRGNYMQKEEK
jgi:hypothetical protein